MKFGIQLPAVNLTAACLNQYITNMKRAITNISEPVEQEKAAQQQLVPVEKFEGFWKRERRYFISYLILL